MRWLPSLGIGLVTALATAALGAWAADVGTKWHGVPDMEGQRGMAIAFLFIPLALVAGLVIGIVVARRGGDVATAGEGFLRLGKALGIAVGGVLAALGLAWLTTNHPPTIDGKELALEWEMQLPPTFPVRDSLRSADFRVGLVGSGDDRAYTTVRFDDVTSSDAGVLVSGYGYLASRSMRSISMTWGPFDAHNPTPFTEIPLAPVPSRKDMEWSDWYPLSRLMDLSEVPADQQARVRYRVVFADGVVR